LIKKLIILIKFMNKLVVCWNMLKMDSLNLLLSIKIQHKIKVEKCKIW
jgi:hypothetical protein